MDKNVIGFTIFLIVALIVKLILMLFSISVSYLEVVGIFFIIMGVWVVFFNKEV